MGKIVVFKKVMVSDRLPSESGMQITNNGIVHFLSGCGRFMGHEPQWWLEEIEIPSNEEIEGMAIFYDTFESDQEDKYSSYKIGANYILNKLK